MSTIVTDVIEPCEIKNWLATISKCDDPGWIEVLLLDTTIAKIALFHSIELKNSRRIHFHSFCCGMAKSGIWELEGSASQEDIRQVAEFSRKLVIEYQHDSLKEKLFWLARLKQENYDGHVFCQ